jgi:hypothetical protein
MKRVFLRCMLLLMLSGGLVACQQGHPVPGEAFESCIDKGGVPLYTSDAFKTKFTCVMPDD